LTSLCVHSERPSGQPDQDENHTRWLYLRRGLDAAILSHFVIDIIVHVVRPLIERGFA